MAGVQLAIIPFPNKKTRASEKVTVQYSLVHWLWTKFIHQSISIVVDRFDSTAQPWYNHHQLHRCNYNRSTGPSYFVCPLGILSRQLRHSLVSCRGSCVTPCRQPGASKHTPTTRRTQVGIATRTVVSQRTVLSTVLLYYEQQQWTRDCAHSCWTYLIVATRKVLSLWQ